MTTSSLRAAARQGNLAPHRGSEGRAMDIAGGEQFDVIVVGAGNAATCAALSARESGARVLMLEVAPEEARGGNSCFTGGAFRVKQELPPRASSGATSSISTRAPLSRADSAAQVAALPAPTTITSNCSPPAMSMARPSDPRCGARLPCRAAARNDEVVIASEAKQSQPGLVVSNQGGDPYAAAR